MLGGAKGRSWLGLCRSGPAECTRGSRCVKRARLSSQTTPLVTRDMRRRFSQRKRPVTSRSEICTAHLAEAAASRALAASLDDSDRSRRPVKRPSLAAGAPVAIASCEASSAISVPSATDTKTAITDIAKEHR